MKSLKKIAVSFLVVLAMSCTMIGTWAADTNQIISYTVETKADGGEWTAANIGNIVISSADMLRVNVTLQNAGEVTLMSYKDGVETYNDSNIQYVAQETAGNSASIQFRPRTSLGGGLYVIKIGGSGVSTPVSFKYLVKGNLPVTANSNSLCVVPEGVACGDVATYTIEGINADAVVKFNGTPLASTHYTIDTTAKTLKIKPSALGSTMANGLYALEVTVGDKTGYSTINVCPAVTYTSGNFGDAVTGDVCATTVPDGEGGYKIPLKPYPSYLSENGTKVTHTDGLFIGWSDGSTTYTADDVVYIEYAEARKTLTAQYGSQDTKLTKTGYQKIKYTGRDNKEHDAIRFVALVDTNSVGISNITGAGFVVSDICSSPTKEGGFAFTNEQFVYNSIKTRANVDDATNKNVAKIAAEMGDTSGTYDCILTSVLDIDTTNTYQNNQTIGAVAYIEYIDGTGTHRVYGAKGTPQSFANLPE